MLKKRDDLVLSYGIVHDDEEEKERESWIEGYLSAQNEQNLKWTREPPKEDGYYWFYSENGKPQIVQVVTWVSPRTRKVNRTVNYFDEYYEPLEDACENAIWAGPIEEPKEGMNG